MSQPHRARRPGDSSSCASHAFVEDAAYTLPEEVARMMLSHDVYQFVSNVLRPYTFLVLLSGLALGNLWRRCRERRRAVGLAAVPFVALVMISLPPVGYLALGTLEWPYPPLETRPTRAEAIVVLAAGAMHPDPVRRRDELTANSLIRCVHAAEVYHQGPPLPVLVTGGIVDPRTIGRPDGDLMREFLVGHGVRPDDVIVENGSRSTYENAVETRKLLEERGIREVVLVTDASHMRRAVRCFRKQGIHVTPSACRHRATEFPSSVSAWLPDVGAASGCINAAHEWFGLAWYWLQGRI
jgi:uncharacterized SAM-binding protein YcdF (DUF218 family)